MNDAYGLQNIIDESVTVELIEFAIENELEQASWELWLTIYPHFTKETFIPFEEFKDDQVKAKPRKQIKTNEEIMEELLPLVEKFEKKNGGE